eukprot:1161247-Pelagomonas_calceolata.AAC.1
MSPYLARGKKLLVFCNSVDSSRAVEYFCREQGMPAVCYNGEMTVAARQESMERFSGAGKDLRASRKTVCCIPARPPIGLNRSITLPRNSVPNEGSKLPGWAS